MRVADPDDRAQLWPGPIVLFDGVCNLCTGMVDFILARDPDGRFRFGSLQSEAGRRLLDRLGIPAGDLGTVILIEGGRHYTKSTAVLRIGRHLSGLWRLASLLLVVPRGLRDRIYDLVARNRYRWFGRRDRCRLPSPGEEDRFLA